MEKRIVRLEITYDSDKINLYDDIIQLLFQNNICKEVHFEFGEYEKISEWLFQNGGSYKK